MNNVKSKINILAFLVVNSIIVLFAWKIQKSLYLNNDVSTLLLFTSRLLAGGNYLTDFFTPNPPLIFFIYTPVVVLNSLLGISKTVLFTHYVFSIALLSVCACYVISKRISKCKKNFPVYFFNTVLTAIFLIFPLYHFGQRDHFLVILTMPYLVTIMARLSGVNLSRIVVIFSGIFAGFGFALKPQFLIVFALVEICYCIHKKNILAWLRIETVSILSLISIYIFICLIFFQNYFYDVLPYLWEFYYANSLVAWHQIFFHPLVIFFLFPIILYFSGSVNNEFRYVSSVLFTALIGFVLSFICQKDAYYYHAIPAFSLAVLLFFLQLYLVLSGNQSNFKIKIRLGSLFLIVLILPCYILTGTYLSGLSYKKRVLSPLIAFMKENDNNNKLYIFSNLPRFGFPLIEYTNTKVAQRFDTFWMTSGLLKKIEKEGNEKVVQHFRNNDYFFMQMINEDFQKNKPDFVFIEAANDKQSVFNYLYYFLQDKEFVNQWRFYNYFTTIRFNGIDHFLLVYKRKV